MRCFLKRFVGLLTEAIKIPLALLAISTVEMKWPRLPTSDNSKQVFVEMSRIELKKIPLEYLTPIRRRLY